MPRHSTRTTRAHIGPWRRRSRRPRAASRPARSWARPTAPRRRSTSCAELWFDDMDALQAALASEEGTGGGGRRGDLRQRRRDADVRRNLGAHGSPVRGRERTRASVNRRQTCTCLHDRRNVQEIAGAPSRVFVSSGDRLARRHASQERRHAPGSPVRGRERTRARGGRRQTRTKPHESAETCRKSAGAPSRVFVSSGDRLARAARLPGTSSRAWVARAGGGERTRARVS